MPDTDFQSAVRATPIESALGVILAITGAGLSVAGDSIPLRIVGYVVSMSGTILLSWALTKAWVARQHNRELTRNLQAIARPLGTVASQLSYAIVEADADEDNGIDTELIRLNVQHLYGVLSELQGLMGSPLGVEEILAIKGRLDMLGKKLAAADEAPTSDTSSDQAARSLLKAAAEEVNDLKRQLQTAVPRRERTYATANVLCPTCRQSVSAVIGDLPGDSIMTTCTNCSSRFHLNRIADGSVITRPWGASKQRTSVMQPCASCGVEAPFSYQRGNPAPVVRFCLKCYAKIKLDPESRTVSVVRDAQAPVEGNLAADLSYVVCPHCAEAKRTIFNRDGEFYAVCKTDDVLLHARRGLA